MARRPLCRIFARLRETNLLDKSSAILSAEPEGAAVTQQTTIVVPCYNEETRLPESKFLEFVDATPSTSFLFVNDGSRDGTWGLLQRMSLLRPGRIACRSLAQNSGKAEAVRQGMLQAFATGSTYVGFFDADLATPLDAIETFCDVLDRRSDVDIVIGSRLRLQGRKIVRQPARRLLGKLFATCASLSLGVSLQDTQCGAKIFRNCPSSVSLFVDPFCTRWIFDVELLARRVRDLRAQGKSSRENLVYELPLDEWRDVAGSKLKSGDFLKAAGELLRIYRTYLMFPPQRMVETAQPSPLGSGHLTTEPARRAA